MAHRLARFTRIFVGLLAILVLLPPFVAAGEILNPSGSFRLPLIGALYFGECWVAVLVHELGHLTAAYMTGRRVHIIAVLPMAYLVRARKFTWSPKEGTGDLGGFVLAMPGLEGDGHRGEVIFALGGVLANSASSAIGFATIGVLSSGRHPDLFVGISAVLGTFAALSLVLAIVNLVPIWGPGLSRSDGAFFLDALRGRQNSRRNHLTRLLAMQIDGVLPTEWNPALIAQVELDADAKDHPAFEAINSLLYTRYLALGDLGRARARLERITSPDAPIWMKVAEAFFLAYVDRNGEAAQRILDQLPRAAQRHYDYWRAMAVARDILGDRAGVVAAVAKARTFASKNKTPLDNDDVTLLDTLQRKAEMPPALEGN